MTETRRTDKKPNFSKSLSSDKRGLAEITTILILLVFAVLISSVVIVFVTGYIPQSTPPHNAVIDASIDAETSTLILVHQTGDAIDLSSCYITLFNENNVVQVGIADTSGHETLRAGYASLPITVNLNPGQNLQSMAKYIVKVYWSEDDRQIAVISTVAH